MVAVMIPEVPEPTAVKVASTSTWMNSATAVPVQAVPVHTVASEAELLVPIFKPNWIDVPADGIVTRIAYRHGSFVNASLDKASDDNERNAIALRLSDGREIAVVQIAGLIARRIVCNLREGDAVQAGQRLGIIRFGSRTDLYLPEGVRPLVALGQTMIGGETVIAELSA